MKSIEMQFSPKSKTFSQFFSPFLTLHQILIISKKKIRLIADFFPNILKRKCVVTYMSKEPCVRTLMDSQHVTHDTLLKTTRQWLCHIFWSPWNNFSLKNYILVVSKILRLFDKLWTPGEKFSLSVKVSV